MKPLAALAVPGMYIVYKYNQFKRQQQETNKRKITERELAHLNHKIDKLLIKLDEHEPELANTQEEECVICCSAKATMQTYPCGHRVVCRRCFVKTIHIAVSQRMLPLRCVICRTKILKLKQTTSSYYFRGALSTLNSASPNSPISPTYIFDQHQRLANLAGFRASSVRSDNHLGPEYDHLFEDKSYFEKAHRIGERNAHIQQKRPSYLQLPDQYDFGNANEKENGCKDNKKKSKNKNGKKKSSELNSCQQLISSPSIENRLYIPEHSSMTLYASRQRKSYINYRKKYKCVANKVANLPPIAELESPSHSYRSASDEEEDRALDDEEEEDLMLSSASTPLMSNYKKSFIPSFLRPKSAMKLFRNHK